MTDVPGSLASESWAFALKLYAEPGVREACLRLQEDEDVDVMLLLVAVFAASRKHMRLSFEDVRGMDDASRVDAPAALAAEGEGNQDERGGQEHPARMTPARAPQVAQRAEQVGGADQQSGHASRVRVEPERRGERALRF